MIKVTLYCEGGVVGMGDWDGNEIIWPSAQAMEAICDEDFELLERELRARPEADQVEIIGSDGCTYAARRSIPSR